MLMTLGLMQYMCKNIPCTYQC